MVTSSPSTALVPASPIFSNAERLALAGFLAGYSGLTSQRTSWVCASTPASATSTMSSCSAPGVLTSNASAAPTCAAPASTTNPPRPAWIATS